VRFRQLDILNLRNLRQVSIQPSSGINYLFGGNGAGKTAVLEAVHLLARGRSFRSGQVSELVRAGEDHLTVRAAIEDEHRGEQRVALLRGRGGRGELRINGEPGRRVSQAAVLMPVQVLGPLLSDLVFGGPGVRRQWLDWGVFHVEPGYLDTLRSYLQAVRQRNAALKRSGGSSGGAGSVEAFSESVATLGEDVSRARRGYLVELEVVLARALAAMAPEMTLEIGYRQGWPDEESLLKTLGDWRRREVKSGSTQFGPHRADLELRVAGQVAGGTVSRGQGKILASAMMLAQAELLQRRGRRSTAFLIDDIGAELDSAHTQRFFQALKAVGSQIFATSNDPPGWIREVAGTDIRVFHVEQGSVTEGPS
tara:strand:+ start:6998 stop:8098 length:1101 start_codon:yes stop_codon:yes gene_type:complete